MKITAFIKKDFQGNFHIFSKDGKYYVQWDFVPSPDVAGWGNVTEDSTRPQGDYKSDIKAIIRLRYDEDDEFALQRQRDTKPDDFAEYNAFCEAAKAEAKKHN